MPSAPQHTSKEHGEDEDEDDEEEEAAAIFQAQGAPWPLSSRSDMPHPRAASPRRAARQRRYSEKPPGAPQRSTNAKDREDGEGEDEDGEMVLLLLLLGVLLSPLCRLLLLLLSSRCCCRSAAALAVLRCARSTKSRAWSMLSSFIAERHTKRQGPVPMAS